MKRLALILSVLCLYVVSYGQIRENIIRMDSVNDTFIEPYGNKQLIRIAADSNLYALTHATIVGQSMQTVLDSGWYKIIGARSGGVTTVDTLFITDSIYDLRVEGGYFYFNDTIYGVQEIDDTLLAIHATIDTLVASVYDSLSNHLDTLFSHNTRINNNVDTLAIHLDTLQSHNDRINALVGTWVKVGTNIENVNTGDVVATTEIKYEGIVEADYYDANHWDVQPVVYKSSDSTLYKHENINTVYDTAIYLNLTVVGNLGSDQVLLNASGADYWYDIISATIYINVDTQLEVGTQDLSIHFNDRGDPVYSLSNATIELASSKMKSFAREEGIVNSNAAVYVTLNGGSNPASGSAAMTIYLTYQRKPMYYAP